MKCTILSFFALFLFTTHPATSQVFPLKISDSGNFIVSKNGLPFLLVGTTFEIRKETPTDINNRVFRLNHAGFNAIFLQLNFNPIQQPGNLSDKRKLNARVRYLKTLLRAAAIQNMVVLVYLPSLPATVHSATKTLQEFAIHKTRRFKNLIMVLDSTRNPGVIASKTRQLKGTVQVHESEHRILLSDNVNRKDHPKIVLSGDGIPYSDSTLFQIRKDAYTSVLTGASGFIAETDILSQQHTNRSVALAFQLKELKVVVNQLPWQTFSKIDDLIPENFARVTAINTITPDSSMATIYIPAFTTFSIDLSVFSAPVSLEWVNPATGSKFSQMIEISTAPELFFPPVTQPSSDWFLILKKR